MQRICFTIGCLLLPSRNPSPALTGLIESSLQLKDSTKLKQNKKIYWRNIAYSIEWSCFKRICYRPKPKVIFSVILWMASDYGDREVSKDVEEQYKQISLGLDENEHRLG